MKLLSRLKFPLINNSRNYKINDEEKNIFKLSSPKNIQNFRAIKIPKNIRSINYQISKKKIDNSKSESTNSYYNSIQTLLSKNLSISNNLKQKFDIKKITSTKSILRNKILALNQDKLFIRRNQSEENDISLFLNKLDRMYGVNPQLKMINDISKELIKENENNTNGNEVFNNTEEELKESISYILGKDDIKKKIKIKLTPNNNNSVNKTNLNKIPDLENFHLNIPRYIPYGYENIKNLKYIQNLAQEKLKFGSTTKSIDYNKLNDLKFKKFKFIMKKKIKDLGNKMKDNQLYMKDIDDQIASCIQKARNNLKIFSEKLSKE